MPVIAMVAGMFCVPESHADTVCSVSVTTATELENSLSNASGSSTICLQNDITMDAAYTVMPANANVTLIPAPGNGNITLTMNSSSGSWASIMVPSSSVLTIRNITFTGTAGNVFTVYGGFNAYDINTSNLKATALVDTENTGIVKANWSSPVSMSGDYTNAMFYIRGGQGVFNTTANVTMNVNGDVFSTQNGSLNVNGAFSLHGNGNTGIHQEWGSTVKINGIIADSIHYQSTGGSGTITDSTITNTNVTWHQSTMSITGSNLTGTRVVLESAGTGTIGTSTLHGGIITNGQGSMLTVDGTTSDATTMINSGKFNVAGSSDLTSHDATINPVTNQSSGHLLLSGSASVNGIGTGIINNGSLIMSSTGILTGGIQAVNNTAGSTMLMSSGTISGSGVGVLNSGTLILEGGVIKENTTAVDNTGKLAFIGSTSPVASITGSGLNLVNTGTLQQASVNDYTIPTWPESWNPVTSTQSWVRDKIKADDSTVSSILSPSSLMTGSWVDHEGHWSTGSSISSVTSKNALVNKGDMSAWSSSSAGTGTTLVTVPAGPVMHPFDVTVHDEWSDAVTRPSITSKSVSCTSDGVCSASGTFEATISLPASWAFSDGSTTLDVTMSLHDDGTWSSSNGAITSTDGVSFRMNARDLGVWKAASTVSIEQLSGRNRIGSLHYGKCDGVHTQITVGDDDMAALPAGNGESCIIIPGTTVRIHVNRDGNGIITSVMFDNGSSSMVTTDWGFSVSTSADRSRIIITVTKAPLTASVNIQLKDNSGASIPNAQFTVDDGNGTSTLMTNDQGMMTFNDLDTDNTITVRQLSLTGYQTVSMFMLKFNASSRMWVLTSSYDDVSVDNSGTTVVTNTPVITMIPATGGNLMGTVVPLTALIIGIIMSCAYRKVFANER